MNRLKLLMLALLFVLAKIQHKQMIRTLCPLLIKYQTKHRIIRQKKMYKGHALTLITLEKILFFLQFIMKKS